MVVESSQDKCPSSVGDVAMARDIRHNVWKLGLTMIACLAMSCSHGVVHVRATPTTTSQGLGSSVSKPRPNGLCALSGQPGSLSIPPISSSATLIVVALSRVANGSAVTFLSGLLVNESPCVVGLADKGATSGGRETWTVILSQSVTPREVAYLVTQIKRSGHFRSVTEIHP